MRKRLLAAATIAVALITGSADAGAYVRHTVARGESLWSIAIRDGVPPSVLAAANGLSIATQVRAGTVVAIPAYRGTASRTLALGPVRRAAAPAPLGAYVTRRGDTLWGLARRTGAPMAEIAWMNGVHGSRLRAGTVLRLPTTTPGPLGPVHRYVAAPPYPTSGRATSTQIGSIAATEGVSSSLASAIAWQESGFSNHAVSTANARGVMQVMPGTWDWIQHNLARSPLNPASPTDNVRAGVLYLRQLLHDSGGNAATAVAGYYQGLGSVRRIGMLPSTRRYVANVLALRGRFMR